MNGDIRVKDHPDLRRSGAVSGLILNTNSDAYHDTIKARERLNGIEAQLAQVSALLGERDTN